VNPSANDTERFMAAQRAQWNDHADGWQTWCPQFEVFWQEITQLILAALEPQPGMRILDVASGVGQPALTLAALVGPSGSVIGIDLAAAMIAAARENARARGLANVVFQEAAAERMPFEDAAFDAVTCRCGVIYFADVGRGLREMRRVLRPDGRAVITAWGPIDRHVAGKVFAVLDRYLPPPPPPELGAPNANRFAEAGMLTAALEAAGFRDVQEAMHIVSLPWPGTAEQGWRAHLDILPGLRHRLETLSTEQRTKLQQQVIAVIREDEDKEHQQLNHSAAVVIASARR
jgi:SAM-dependent methyltransferase